MPHFFLESPQHFFLFLQKDKWRTDSIICHYYIYIYIYFYFFLRRWSDPGCFTFHSNVVWHIKTANFIYSAKNKSYMKCQRVCEQHRQTGNWLTDQFFEIQYSTSLYMHKVYLPLTVLLEAGHFIRRKLSVFAWISIQTGFAAVSGSLQFGLKAPTVI